VAENGGFDDRLAAINSYPQPCRQLFPDCARSRRVEPSETLQQQQQQQQQQDS
jgi:hypothetical protein